MYGKLFISWGDFLGTGTVATSQRTFRTYTETSQWARRENIRSARQWQERCQQPDFPTDVPTHPERVYRDFPGWGTFLGTANIANIKRTFRPCEEAARLVQAEGIANQEAWRERVKQPEFPLDIPRAPDHTYGQKFPGWGAFLNTPTFQARSTVVPSRNSLAERLDQPTVNESLDRPSPFPWRRSPRTC